MNQMKKILAGCAVVVALASSSVTAFAATYATPAEAAAALTGKTIEQVMAEFDSGKSFGAIAAEAGKLEEYQQAVLEIREDALDAGVSAGTLSQEQADAAIADMEQWQAACDGTGTGRCGLGRGAGVGGGYGRGQGRGNGRGLGLRDGSCLYR